MQTLNLTDNAGTVYLNGHVSFLGADLVAGNSTVGPESGLTLLSDLVQIAIEDFALPSINNSNSTSTSTSNNDNNNSSTGDRILTQMRSCPRASHPH